MTLFSQPQRLAAEGLDFVLPTLLETHEYEEARPATPIYHTDHPQMSMQKHCTRQIFSQASISLSLLEGYQSRDQQPTALSHATFACGCRHAHQSILVLLALRSQSFDVSLHM